MFWTMEKLQNFAFENGISIDDVLKAVQLGFLFAGFMFAKIFHDASKSSFIEKLFAYIKNYVKN